ncbi:MAG: hypothetical protein Tsb0017_09290 [Geothermobacteraceae bacterium]
MYLHPQLNGALPGDPLNKTEATPGIRHRLPAALDKVSWLPQGGFAGQCSAGHNRQHPDLFPLARQQAVAQG